MKVAKLKFKITGFSLIELLIVISIIGIFSAILYTGFSDARAESRDAQRQADLMALKNAIELYKQENGRYPEGCNGAGVWSGQTGSYYECADSAQHYIVGIFPTYIRNMPLDPKPNGPDSGYAYKTNVDGTVYKLVAFQTVEKFSTVDGTSVDDSMRVFMFCPFDGFDTDALCADTDPYSDWSGNVPNHCVPTHSDGLYRSSYALWGGYADWDDDDDIETYTEAIVCDKPS